MGRESSLDGLLKESGFKKNIYITYRNSEYNME